MLTGLTFGTLILNQQTMWKCCQAVAQMDEDKNFVYTYEMTRQ